MATGRLSGLLAEVRGSIGGETFRMVGGQLVLGAKSSGRLNLRGTGPAAMAATSRDLIAWEKLAEDVRNAWEAAAKECRESTRSVWLNTRAWTRENATLTQWSLAATAVTGGGKNTIATVEALGVSIACNWTNAVGVEWTEDGYHWHAATGAGSGRWQVCFLDGASYKIVVIEQDGAGRILESYDGKEWTETTSPGVGLWTSAATSLATYSSVAVGNGGVGFAMYRHAMGAWTMASSAPSGIWTDVARSDRDGLYIAVGDSGTSSAMTSTDGVTWAKNTNLPGGTFATIGYSPDRHEWLAILKGATDSIYRSTNGLTWSHYGNLGYADWYRIRWCTSINAWVATRISGTNNVGVSRDGITWQMWTIPGVSYATDVTYDQRLGLILAACWGSGSTVAISPITLLPETADGKPLTRGGGDRLNWVATMPPTLRLAAPTISCLTASRKVVAGRRYITFSVSGIWTPDAAQASMTVWFGRPLGKAEKSYWGKWKKAGTVTMWSSPWTAADLPYDFEGDFVSGTRVPVRIRTWASGERYSRPITGVLTLT